jgi:hypothetical protein
MPFLNTRELSILHPIPDSYDPRPPLALLDQDPPVASTLVATLFSIPKRDAFVENECNLFN